MSKIMKIIILAMAVLLIGNIASAKEVPQEQVRGLDEQVQEIKSNVMNLAVELNLLEKQLLYPSNSEISIFVSLFKGEDFQLDSLDLKLNNKAVAHHLYTSMELEALRKGGVQRLYTGNVTIGAHPLEVTFRGKSVSKKNIKKTETFTVQKEIGPGIVEITLTEDMISFKTK